MRHAEEGFAGVAGCERHGARIVADLGALATDKQTDFGLGNLTEAVAKIQGVSFGAIGRVPSSLWGAACSPRSSRVDAAKISQRS